MDNSTKMWRIEEVANKLSVSQKSIRRYIHSGELKSNKIAGVHKIEDKDLNNFVEKSKSQPQKS